MNGPHRYVRDPLILMLGKPRPVGTHLTPLPDPEDTRLPDVLRDALADGERTLVDRGFSPPLRAAHAVHETVTSCVSLVEHPVDGGTGFISAVLSRTSGASISATFATRFADGWTVTTSNFASVLRTPSRPKIDGARFVAVSDIGTLYDIHRARVGERAARAPVVPTTRGADPLAYEDAESRTVNAFWVQKGYHRWIDGDQMQITPLGATLASWRGLFPWKQITEWRHDRKSRAILKRLRLR